MAASQGRARRFADLAPLQWLEGWTCSIGPRGGAGCVAPWVPGLLLKWGSAEGSRESRAAARLPVLQIPFAGTAVTCTGTTGLARGGNDADSFTLLLCIFVTLSQFSHSFVLNYLLISFPSSSICSLSHLLSHLLFVSFASVVRRLISFFHSSPF